MAKKIKQPKVTSGPNPAYIRAAVSLRSSGAAGSHDSRPNRQRTRATVRRAAVKADSH